MWNRFEIKPEGGKSLAAYSWPIEEAKALTLIVHGIGEHLGRYDRVASFFNEGKIALMGADLRGHGNSPGKRGHAFPREALLKDIDSLVKEGKNKYPGRPIILYGHSMGGNIVLDYRVRGEMASDIEKFLITGPWIKLKRKVPIIQKSFIKFLARLAPAITMKTGIKSSDLGNPASVGPYEKDPLVHPYISLGTLYDGFKIGEKLERGQYLVQDSCKEKKMLIIHGMSDSICDLEGSKNFISHEDPKFTEFYMPLGICHEVHNGGKESWGDEIIKRMVSWILEGL